MPNFPDVLLCALAALILSVCVGMPLARWLVQERVIAWGLAPSLGWAVFTTAALPIVRIVGFSQPVLIILCGATALAGGFLAFRASARLDDAAFTIGLFVAAALVAILPALGLWPKLWHSGGLVLADPLFDHSKIAIIDDIVRLGLPPGNPFYGGTNTPPNLVYYYLWHFNAAMLAKAIGAKGWEADIALTWFTAFASLSLIMALAVNISRRRIAAPLVLLLCLTASLGPLLRRVIGPDLFSELLSHVHPPHSWIFQATWVPQHLASANCVVLAVLILGRLSWRRVPLLAIVVAAAFESSAWVGGIIFGAAAAAIGVVLVVCSTGVRDRVIFLAKAAAAAVLAAAIAYPFLRDEFATTAARHLVSPIALKPYEVLGPFFAEPLRRALDLPAYWIVLLVLALPAIYITGCVSIFEVLTSQQATPEKRAIVLPLTLLAGASFGIPWLFASTIANNDLGWRGVLPGILVLTAFAAAGLARWLMTAPKCAVAAGVCLALGLPGGLAIIMDNATGRRLASSAAFAETPEMWAAVRSYTAPDERVANNPLFFWDTVQWPVNISWALFADRRSCFAGWNLARAFVPLPEPKLDHLETLFDRVFAGEGSPQDIDELTTDYDCRVVVLTARDGAWKNDPFAADPRFRLVNERAEKWRIYRISEVSSETR
jgi:hypothetical protein